MERFKRKGVQEEMARFHTARYGSRPGDRVGPGADALDAEVPAEIVQKNAGPRPRSRHGRAVDERAEDVAHAALHMKESMEAELDSLRREKDKAKEELRSSVEELQSVKDQAKAEAQRFARRAGKSRSFGDRVAAPPRPRRGYSP